MTIDVEQLGLSLAPVAEITIQFDDGREITRWWMAEDPVPRIDTVGSWLAGPVIRDWRGPGTVMKYLLRVKTRRNGPATDWITRLGGRTQPHRAAPFHPQR